jgi:hypothetical protein
MMCARIAATFFGLRTLSSRQLIAPRETSRSNWSYRKRTTRLFASASVRGQGEGEGEREKGEVLGPSSPEWSGMRLALDALFLAGTSNEHLWPFT